MNRSIEQALLSLLPTQNSNLPPPLVELAGSLLAQSRNRASTLKAEEEIARPYACANIACDRLKISLNLPPIEPRPPIPPRIYKRLYNHLDKILPNSSTGSRARSTPLNTPRSKLQGSSANRPLPSRGTPTKELSLSHFRTPDKNQTPSKVTSHKAIGVRVDAASIPPWIRPTVRFMCKELSTPELGPTIMAGMESILVPHGRKLSDEWVNDNITTTLGAIYFYVSERAQWKSSDDQVDQTRYQAARKVIIKTLDGARETATFKGSDQDTAWVGWRSIRPRDLDKAVMEVNKRGWLQSDWYQGMQDLADRTNADDLEDEDHDATEQNQSVEIRRADSMFQDRYDLLSQRRRDDFKVWKAGILERIAALENSTVPMEIDS